MKFLELKVPPVLCVIVFGACIRLINLLLPGLNFSLPYQRTITSILTIGGGTISAVGLATFFLAKTTVNPVSFKKVTSLVDKGIYKFSRNPMYAGLLFVLTGWWYFNPNLISLILLPGFILYINRFQILPEERILESIFAEEFLKYSSRVRRWL